MTFRLSALPLRLQKIKKKVKSIWRWNWGTHFGRITFKDKCWRKCPEFQQFLVCCNMGPDLSQVLSCQRLQWLSSDLSHRCLPTPLIVAQFLVSQKEAFPSYFFFGRLLFLAFSNHEQLTRCTTGPASVWRFPKNSGLLIKISPNNDSFKPTDYHWKIRYYFKYQLMVSQ